MSGPMRAVRFQDGSVVILDQTRLPGEVVYLAADRVEQVREAIQTLRVRGADAIGVAAAYGMVLAAREDDAQGRRDRLQERGDLLSAARPTAVHLRRAVDRVMAAVPETAWGDANAVSGFVLREAAAIEAEDRAMCRRIGAAGAELLSGVSAVLTHCNAGWLATAGYGTALAPLYVLKERGRSVRVYADETRPLLQGSRLTAWELRAAGLEVIQVVDGAAATVIARGMVGAVLVGADRIAMNGDTANKIGTYPLALAARAHGVPFYVAAPASTFDPRTPTGAAIPVEERDPDEVTCVMGRRVSPAGVGAFNPAFDITPAALVTAFITDRGVVPASKAARVAAAGNAPRGLASAGRGA